MLRNFLLRFGFFCSGWASVPVCLIKIESTNFETHLSPLCAPLMECNLESAPGGEEVVDDEDALPLGHGVLSGISIVSGHFLGLYWGHFLG